MRIWRRSKIDLNDIDNRRPTARDHARIAEINEWLETTDPDSQFARDLRAERARLQEG